MAKQPTERCRDVLEKNETRVNWAKKESVQFGFKNEVGANGTGRNDTFRGQRDGGAKRFEYLELNM